MRQKNNGKSAAAFKLFVCVLFILLLSETAFAQVSGLALNLRSDIRFEQVTSRNTVVGYNLYVQKKPGMESVMLTEPTGNYALRTLVKYEANDAIRNLSGKRLPSTDLYSRFSIISSSPIQDGQFGKAFKLFIPATVVYGNPSAPRGQVSMDVFKGIQINIRTFDQKYGDPNRSMFQNNLVMVGALAQNTVEVFRPADFVVASPSNNTDALKSELDNIPYDELLNQLDSEQLNKLLISILLEMKSRDGL